MFDMLSLSEDEMTIWEAASIIAKHARIQRDNKFYYQAARRFDLSATLFEYVGDKTLATCDRLAAQEMWDREDSAILD